MGTGYARKVGKDPKANPPPYSFAFEEVRVTVHEGPHALKDNENDDRSSVVSRRLKPRAPAAKPPEGG